MKTKFILPALGISLLLAAPALRAQGNLGTNISDSVATNLSGSLATNLSGTTVTNSQARKFPRPLEGEQLVLPADTKARLGLTAGQQAQLKPIEEDFASTSQEYKAANQPRIDAANEASRRARAGKDQAQIQAAQLQLQQVWAGLQSYRAAAAAKVKPLLTPDQLKILEDPKNQWQEDHAGEANDLLPSGIVTAKSPK